MSNWAPKASVAHLLKKAASVSLLLTLLILAFWVRSFTFWLPHWTGDQSQYIALAMKMNHTEGLSAYNLREVNVRSAQMSVFKDFNFVIPTYAAGDEGTLMKSYYGFGLSYYDMPLWYKAPLLPYVLKWSHNIFLGSEKPFVVPQTNMGTAVFKVKPKVLLESQFWLVIVPLAASLGTLVVIYFFTRNFLSVSGSLMAVWIMAFNPVSILCSNRIWTEDLQTFLLWVGILLYWKGYFSKKTLLPFCSGILIGLSVLTNQKTMLLFPGMWFYGVISQDQFSIKKPASWIKAAFHPNFLWMLVGFALVTHRWFLAAYHQLGHPLWQPDYSSATSILATTWVKHLQSRPHSLIVYIIGGSYLCPPIFFGYMSVIPSVRNFFRLIKRKLRHSVSIFLWVSMLPLLRIFMLEAHHSAEHRYLMPILPALSILAAMSLTRLHEKISGYFLSKNILTALIWSLLILSAVWSVRIAWHVIMRGKVLIDVPF